MSKKTETQEYASVAEAIEALEKGLWGHKGCIMAAFLRERVPKEMLGRPARVALSASHHGWGVDSCSVHGLAVFADGLADLLSEEVTVGPTAVDHLFGWSSLPFIARAWEGGGLRLVWSRP